MFIVFTLILDKENKREKKMIEVQGKMTKSYDEIMTDNGYYIPDAWNNSIYRKEGHYYRVVRFDEVDNYQKQITIVLIK